MLPVPAGSPLEDLKDASATGLGDYLRFWLRDSLNAKLAQLVGTSSDACPSDSVFDYNPESGSIWVRNETPALYVWSDGASTDVQSTLVYRHVQRDLYALYVFDELVYPGDAGARSGLPAIVAQTFFKSAERGRHPSYGYGSDAVGTPIARSLSWVQWWCTQCVPGILWEIPGGSGTAGGIGPGEGQIQRGHPCVKARFRIEERIDGDTFVIPDDVLGDSPLAIDTGPNTTDVTNILNRVLIPPDGAEP